MSEVNNHLENEGQIVNENALQKTVRVLTKSLAVSAQETLDAGKEITLTGNVKTNEGKEYVETEEGLWVERNALRRSTDVLPGESKLLSGGAAVLLKKGASWETGNTLTAGTSVQCTGEVIKIDGKKYAQIVDGGYVAFDAMIIASNDTRMEAYAALREKHEADRTSLFADSKDALANLKGGITLFGESYNSGLMGVDRFSKTDNVAVMNKDGQVLRALAKDTGVTLNGHYFARDGYEYMQLTSGEYVRRDELYNSPVLAAAKDVQKSQNLSLETIISTPLTELPRLAAIRLFTKIFGDGPATQYWVAKDTNGAGLLREMALAKHEGVLEFGRVDELYRTTFQIEHRSYERCLRGGAAIVEATGIPVGDYENLPTPQKDLIAHIGHIHERSGMFEQDLLTQICNPNLSWNELVRLMHYKIQAGIEPIGKEVARMMGEPFKNNFPVG